MFLIAFHEVYRLKKILKACPDCIESLAEEAAVIYRCSLFFLLRDTVGQEIMVTASDPEVSDLVCMPRSYETDSSSVL